MKFHAVFLLLIAILALPSRLFTQSIFYDALKLAHLNTAEIDRLSAVKMNEAEKHQWDVIKKFVNNKWNSEAPNVVVLDTLKRRVQTGTSNAMSLLNESGAQLSQANTAMLGIDVGELSGKLLTSLAGVMADRAKSEFYSAYFSKLKDWFDTQTLTIGDESVALKDLFANTYLLVSDEKMSFTRSIGNSIKNVLEEDVKAFPDRCLDSFLIDKPIRSLIIGLRQIKRGDHLTSVLLNMKNELVNEKSNLAHAVRLLNGISQSLRDTTKSRIWIDESQLMRLNTNEIEFYAALLYAKYKSDFDSAGVQIDSSNYQKIFDNIRLICSQLDRYAVLAGRLKTAIENSKITSEMVFDYLITFIDVIDCTVKVLKYPNELITCISYSKTAAIIMLNIDRKEYGKAVIQTMVLVEKIYNEQGAFSKSGLPKFVTLAAEIASSDSVSEMEKILDAAILPAGSYRIKRQADRSVFINSYVGLSGGFEKTIANPLVENSKPYHVSPFGPIGIEYAWACGNGLENKVGSSWSLYLPLFDLGAIVSYRLKSDSVTSIPDLNWQNVIAPGLYLVHGFNNMPLSAGFGVQLAPHLREIGAEKKKSGVWKLSLFLGIDLPLFQLSTAYSETSKILSDKEKEIKNKSKQIKKMEKGINDLNDKLEKKETEITVLKSKIDQNKTEKNK